MNERFFTVIEPTGDERKVAYTTRGEPPLEALQAAVGGLIEGIRVRYEGRVRRAYVNEEGLLDGLPLNPKATVMAREFGYGSIVGPVAVISQK